MIISIRRYLKSTTYRSALFVLVFGLVITLALPPLYKQAKTTGEWIARVNGVEISEFAFRRKVAEQQGFLASFRQQYGAYADLLLKNMGLSGDPKELAFRLLVKDELLNQMVEQMAIHVHADDIVAKLHDPQFVQQELGSLVPFYAFSPDGVINETALRNHLQRLGISVGDFESLLEQAIARRFLMQLVEASVYVPDFDLKQRYIAEQLGKKFSVLNFSLDSFLNKEKKIVITDNELGEFFDLQNQQSKKYWVPEKRGGVQWVFTPASYGITISDKEIESYYEDHKTRDFVDEQTKVQVRRILFKVNDPSEELLVREKAEQLKVELDMNQALFADKAKELSEDIESAAKGGLMPFIERGQRGQAYERGAFLLKEDGDISPIIRTSDGFEILQRVNKKPRTFVALSKVKGDIKALLLKRKFKAEFAADMKDLLARPGEKSEMIAAFAKAQSGKRELVNPIAQDTRALARALFNIPNKDGFNFYTEDETGFAIQLGSIQERNLPELASIKDVVANDLHEARAIQAMNAELEKAHKMTKADRSMASIADELGVKIEHIDWLRRDDYKQMQSLENRGMPAIKMLQLENIGALLAQKADRNAFLIRLNEIESFDEEQFVKKQPKLLLTLEQERKTLVSEGFIASLYRNATINVNDAILNLYQEYSV